MTKIVHFMCKLGVLLIIVFISLTNCLLNNNTEESHIMTSWKNNEEIELFREYLRIPSVHPDIDYAPSVEFLKSQAVNLGLPIQVFCPAKPDKPVVVITWIGKQPKLPSIMLNSHMDVVPAFPEKWTHPPFAAEMDNEGRIFARGSQDMKCVGMQYLGAIRALMKNGVTLKRTLHVTFVPDEEINGAEGMAAFVKTDDFKRLNVGFALDEGYASPVSTFIIFYAERSVWQINFKISGTAGHGSLLLKDTAGEKLNYLLNKMMSFRREEEKRLNENYQLTIGDVTTINLTKLRGGVQSNVVPHLMEACFDIRLALDVDFVAFEKQLRQWCKEAGGGIELEFLAKSPQVAATKLDASNIYWLAFKRTMDELGLSFKPLVLPGGTDVRFVREMGIPAIGFSPMNNTPVLLHDHDEFLKADTYLRGIEIYKKLISAVADV